MEKLIEVIQQERDEVFEEIERAEGSDLANLEGWNAALVWVLKKIEGGER